MSVTKFVSHSFRVLAIAREFNWLPGARYTNIRDIRRFDRLGLLDIDWKSYSFERHLRVARRYQPQVTIAKDVEEIRDLPATLAQARELAMCAEHVVIVPKDPAMAGLLNDLIPGEFRLGFSVPTRYGETPIAPCYFKRPVHLLGGRPDVQRRLADSMPVASLDCNRFTLDAAYGDFFDGETFRPHPKGGYERCIRDSLRNIEALWDGYRPMG